MEPRDPDGLTVIGGRYRLIEQIGSGAMGTVWRAQDELLGRLIAVKEVRLPHVGGIDAAELRARAMREARAAARLSHPNAMTVHDVVDEGEQPWIVMQLVHADSLAEVVASRGPLAPGRVAEIGLALLGAVEAAHQAGILHRDIKPANVLLGYDGRTVLTDFGVATLEGDPALTGTGMLLGSPSYIAPERARGLASGPASDLWSLGATLYTAVEGHPPFDRDTPMGTLTALATEDPPAPTSAGPLTAVLGGLLQRDPERRLGAPEARRLLERARDAASDTSADEATQIQRFEISDSGDESTSSRRWPLRVAAGLVVVVALGIGGVVAADKMKAAPPDPRTSPAAHPTTRATPAPPGMPAAFIGRWSGTLQPRSKSRFTPVALQIEAAAVGAVIGSSWYPALGCSGELRLVSIQGSSQVQLSERIVVPGPKHCTPTVLIDLKVTVTKMSFAGSDGFQGVLTKGGPTG